MFKWREARYEDLEALPEALPEGVDPEEYVIATYSLSLPSALDAWEVARALAIEQSTGTWVPVPGETPEVRRKHVAKAVGVYELPHYEVLSPTEARERNYLVQIAFPWVNFGRQITMLLSTVAGNLMCWEKIKLLDLRFALMINYLTAGLSVLRELAEDPSIKVPILAHMDFSGTMYVSPYSGLSSSLLLGKLPRLAGADIVVYPAPYGKAPFMKERYVRVAHQLTFPFHHLKPTFPMPSGGITPSMVPEVVEDLGKDIVIGTGGGIHAHPMGPRAGARAFRLAVEAVMRGISLQELAKEHEELRLALQMG